MVGNSTSIMMMSKELEALENYIENLKKDNTINHYTAGTLLMKVSRCKELCEKPLTSKNY